MAQGGPVAIPDRRNRSAVPALVVIGRGPQDPCGRYSIPTTGAPDPLACAPRIPRPGPRRSFDDQSYSGTGSRTNLNRGRFCAPGRPGAVVAGCFGCRCGQHEQRYQYDQDSEHSASCFVYLHPRTERSPKPVVQNRDARRHCWKSSKGGAGPASLTRARILRQKGDLVCSLFCGLLVISCFMDSCRARIRFAGAG